VVERWDVDAAAGVFRRVSVTPVEPRP